MDSANKTNAIVNNLFPSNVRDRLLDELEAKKTEDAKPKNAFLSANRISGESSNALEAVDQGSRGVNTSEAIFGSKPIADFFPASTIMVSTCAIRNYVAFQNPWNSLLADV